MSRTVTTEDLFSIMGKYEERISRLERVLQILGENSMGVVVYSGSWPERPTGFAQVTWVGGGVPPSAAVDGDVWVGT